MGRILGLFAFLPHRLAESTAECETLKERISVLEAGAENNSPLPSLHRLAESTAECETLKERISVLEQNNSELNATNQTLKDEYNALHLIYMQMEKNFKEAQVSGRDVLCVI